MRYVTMTLLLAATMFLMGSTEPDIAMYICKTQDCSMVVIEDGKGFSWILECNKRVIGGDRTDGAEYGGNCEKVTRSSGPVP